jgi:pyridoxine/pyridoxamine 5'-phosphate oxidase
MPQENRNLADIRKEYMLQDLNEQQINKNPLNQLQMWLEESIWSNRI